MEERISAIFQQMAVRTHQLIEVKARWNENDLKLRISWTNVTPEEQEMLQIKLLQPALEKWTDNRVYFSYYLRGRWIEFHFEHNDGQLNKLMSQLCLKLDATLYYDLS